MSSSQAKPITVRVLAHDGRELGVITRRPTAGNWRNLGLKVPTITFARGRRLRCEAYADGWAVRLSAGDALPVDMGGGKAP